MLYIPSLNKYISDYGYVYTDEELDYFDKLKRENQVREYSFYDLIAIFPEAKTYIKRKLTSDIKDYKKYLIDAQEYKSHCTSQINKICSTSECRSFYHDYVDICLIKPSIEDVQKKIKKNIFYLSALKPQPKENRNKITDQDIQRAKQIPISNFLQINRSGFAFCPFHKETQGSLKVYEKQNTWYCFSCQKGGDCVDLIMNMQNKSFLESIKFLINK